MDRIMLISGAIGLAPALALLFFALRDYTFPAVEKPYFDDRKVFIFLAFGMIAGSIFFLMEAAFGTANILYVLLVVIVEEMLKFIIFNSRKYSGHIDTTFYAFSFGIGAASIITVGNTYLALTSAVAKASLTAAGILLLVIYAFMIAFMWGSTSAIIGLGAAKREPVHYTVLAIMIHLFYSIVLVPFYMNIEPWSYLSFAVVAVFMLYVFWQTYSYIIPSTIPPEARPEKWRSIKSKEKTGK